MLKPYPYPCKIAITAILKNEADYIKEWLDYHIAAGVGKFYLYDNDSTDNVTDILAPYIERGTVEYIQWPGKLMQNPAYNDAVYRHKFECRYMAMIDLDEFLYPCGGQDIPDVLDDIFSFDSKVGAFAINWRFFGSSGYEKKDLSTGVLARFIRRGLEEFVPNRHVKSIVDPRCTELFYNPHFATYFKGKYAVNECGDVVVDYDNPQLSGKKMVLNHYFTKSKEEFAIKCGRGKADVRGQRKWVDFTHHDVNDVFDDGIVKYRNKIFAAPVSTVKRKPQEVLKVIAEDFPRLSENDIACHLDDLLAYWYFCRTELPRCMGRGRQTEYFTELTKNALKKALNATQELWQFKLFFSYLPQMIKFDKKFAIELFDIAESPVRETFIDKKMWHYYRELISDAHYCRALKEMMNNG